MYHILFISYDGLTDPLGQSQIIPYLKGLSANGYRFTIISCEKPDRYKNQASTINYLLSGLPLRWQPLMYHKNPPVLSAIYDLQKIKQKAKSIHLSDPIDMVHTRSGTPALAGLWLKKKYGIKFLNDIRDFYSQSRIDSGQWPQHKLVYRKVFQYFDKKEKQELECSDGIVCLTHRAANIIKSSANYKADTPLQVIPCSVDLELFSPDQVKVPEQEQLKKQFGIQGSDTVFSYLGSVGTWYLAKEMFSLFNKISNRNPEAKLLVISPDNKETILQIASEAEVQQGKIIITSATRQKVPLLLSLSRYSIFFIKPCYSKQASSPTKLGEIMAMGIPVITNDGIGDVTDIVETSNAGIVLGNINDSGYEEAVRKLDLAKFDKESIRASAEKYFDLQNAVRCYRRIYENILSDRAQGEEGKREHSGKFEIAAIS